ncbi:helix-turn-helix transcriptional regulator [Hamadaea sp. NPDC050747]|uniref:helix-turn-helix domain-containing protein n=1 Tax=Hamadaea sp. NPDC050747 TaxID=3155789 RepID=UPI0033D5E556
MIREPFGQALRRIRGAKGRSLRQLAKAAPVDVALLSRIENGRQSASESVARAVDRALGADGELINIQRLEAAQRPRKAVASDPMRRRTLMTGAVATAFAGLVPPPMAGASPGRVGSSDAGRLQTSAVRLYALDYQHGGETLWQAALSHVAEGYSMLEHGLYGPTVEARLLKATAQVQMCAGWLAFDSGRHDVARSCYTEALALAKQAGDSEVETHALANLAFQANVLGNPRQGSRLAEAADRAAALSEGFPRLPIIPQLRLALAAALTGDASASGRALTRARRVLDRDGDKPTQEWCTFLTPAELDGLDGTCALELRQSDRAIRLLSDAVAAHGDPYARNRALYRVRLARALLDASEPGEAAASALAALDDLQGSVVSWRVSSELDDVARRLTPHVRDQAVANFVSRYTGGHTDPASTEGNV